MTGDGLKYLVEIGILEVVKPHADPIQATYRMIDPDGVKVALDELNGR